MLCGIAVGRLLRGRQTGFVSHIITLLYLLGVEVGANPKIISGLQTLGLEALILTIGGSIGSVFAAWLLWKQVSKGGKA